MHTAYANRTGFTLVEVIAACMIGAFVALVAVGTLRAVTAGREKINTHIATVSELRFAASLIRQDLANLYRDSDPRNCRLVSTLQSTGLDSVNHLIFYAVSRTKARAGQPEGDVYEVEYYLSRQEEKSLLMRRFWPYPDKDVQPGGVLTAIAENIELFNTRYLAEGQWYDQWPEEKQSLPEMVEVTLAAVPPGQEKALTSSFILNFPRLATTQPQEVQSGQQASTQASTQQ
jgi:type II secretion system protein J